MPDADPARSDRREWWVYSEEDDGQVIKAVSAEEAVAKWAAAEWTDVDDGRGIRAFDLSLEHHFTARQTNEIPDDDLTTEPVYEYVRTEACRDR